MWETNMRYLKKFNDDIKEGDSVITDLSGNGPNAVYGPFHNIKGVVKEIRVMIT